jgi:hypothetical protein
MIDLITIEEAKMQLQIAASVTEHDGDIAMKVQQASAILMDFLKLTAPPASWADADTSPVEYTVPAEYKAMTLVILGELFENRESSTIDVISIALQSLARRKRDPAMA